MKTDIPELVKAEILKIDKKAEVILFGSRARGDFKSNSDWDFLILLDKQNLAKELKNTIWDKLYELELKTGTVISSIVHSKSDWKKRSVTPFYQSIKKEGIAA